MSAQTAALKPTGEPVTPVIVKVGGDVDHDVSVPRTSSPVSIDSEKLPFKQTVAGHTWASSVSTSPGRITNLNIVDGTATINFGVNPTLELASVTIRFGPARLIAMETGVPVQNEVYLLFTSPEVPFHVDNDNDWRKSRATFQGKIKSLTLTVGDTQKLNYDFQSEDATVQIDFDLNSANAG